MFWGTGDTQQTGTDIPDARSAQTLMLSNSNFSKDLIFALAKPWHPLKPFLWYAIFLIIGFVILHLEGFQHMDSSIYHRLWWWEIWFCLYRHRLPWKLQSSNQTDYLWECYIFLALPCLSCLCQLSIWDSIAIHLELLQSIPIAK